MDYPDFPLPQNGCTTEIMPGVLWLRMGLPFDLDHINLYLLEDTDGWFVVDTGLGTDTTKSAWDQIFANLDKPVKGVIVTHMHPDHIGLAGWITEKFRVPLYMTNSEYYTARALLNVPQGGSRWNDREYFTRAGLDNETVEKIVSSSKGFASVVSAIPLAYQRLRDGDVLTINGKRWEIMIGRGHSPEHACLFCHEQHVLLSGDHILPKISPNIGVYSTEPEGNALKEYLATLLPFLSLPESTLVLPAHNTPFTGLQDRVNGLRNHHKRHLNALLQACQTPQSVVDCLPVMFKRKLSGRNTVFAVAECLSHLNYLMFDKQLSRTLNAHGVYQYTAIDTPDDDVDIAQPDMDFTTV
ncbi:MBL fold metallo-hydrolase [Alteromonas antoniana]|uniref:MBL fold metallo-hydrolase n=1 Tax=Alteromonas antoniana TaxID=2803813 RepID=UPI001C485392|nr:MBL fold metallo-hydrolase [Alteromonas antoniana]